MKATLLGYSKIDFVSDKGDHVEGNNIYISFNDENVTGQKCERVFVKKDIQIPEQVKIGDSLNLYFNNKAKLEEIKAK